MGWGEMGRNGIGNVRMGWGGVLLALMGWDGMGWDGIGLDRIGSEKMGLYRMG